MSRYVDPRPQSKIGQVRIALMMLLDQHLRDQAIPTSVRFLFYELVARRIVAKTLASAGFKLDYQDVNAARPVEPRKVKVRYACPGCSIHVWGKPELRLECLECEQELI